MKKILKGFTLAETMIVLAVLGVIAVMVIPSLINKNVQTQHRTMVKKAMGVYDKAVANMVLIENIQNETQLKTKDCEVLQKYFKPIQTISKCKFQTADKLWWDINDIKHPMIAFEQEDLTNDKAKAGNKENKAFYLATSYDESSKAFRTDDLQYEKSSGEYGDDMEKLFGFINNQKVDAGAELSDFMKECTANMTGDNKCKVNGYGYTKVHISSNQEACNKAYTGTAQKHIDALATSCSKLTDSDIYVIDDETLLKPTSDEALEAYNNASDEEKCTSSSCASSGDYWLAAKKKCEAQNGHLASLGELSALANVDSKYKSGYFWAGEQYSSKGGYGLGYGSVNVNDNYSSTRKVVCIGN